MRNAQDGEHKQKYGSAAGADVNCVRLMLMLEDLIRLM